MHQLYTCTSSCIVCVCHYTVWNTNYIRVYSKLYVGGCVLIPFDIQVVYICISNCIWLVCPYTVSYTSCIHMYTKLYMGTRVLIQFHIQVVYMCISNCIWVCVSLYCFIYKLYIYVYQAVYGCVSLYSFTYKLYACVYQAVYAAPCTVWGPFGCAAHWFSQYSIICHEMNCFQYIILPARRPAS